MITATMTTKTKTQKKEDKPYCKKFQKENKSNFAETKKQKSYNENRTQKEKKTYVL